jgi:hypothetical protein
VTPSPDHMPYDIMTGFWIGTSVFYSPEGAPVWTVPTHYVIYWVKRPSSTVPGLMHFREGSGLAPVTMLGGPAEEARIKALWGNFVPDNIRRLAAPDYDLTVDYKHATGSGPGPEDKPVDVSGAETAPDVYHFELKERGADARRWYNTHIFPSRNERQTIGPVVDSNNTILFITVHNFTRVSYDVPPSKRRELTSTRSG